MNVRALAARYLECPVTWTIIAINLGVFVVAWLVDGNFRESLSPRILYTFGALWRPAVWDGQYWRLVTAVFLHVGWIHLLWNTWIMYSWCRQIERTVGHFWFAFAYVTTGIGASAVSLLCHKVLGAGASGAGFGMLAVMLSILYGRAGSWGTFMRTPGVSSLLSNVVLVLAIGFGFFSHFMDNYAHLGGFLIGIPCGLILENRGRKHRSQQFSMAAAYCLLILALVVLACVPGLAFKPPGEDE